MFSIPQRKLESSTYLIPGSEVIAGKCWKDFDALGSSFKYPILGRKCSFTLGAKTAEGNKIREAEPQS